MTDQQVVSDLIAVDVGNSRIKVGQFRRELKTAMRDGTLPEPLATFDLPIFNKAGDFDTNRLSNWMNSHISEPRQWLIASVHRGATERLIRMLHNLVTASHANCSIRQLTYRDIPLPIHIDTP